MTLEEFNFILEDRIAKIKAIDEQLDLEHNSYIAFSGGKDSVVLSHLIDIALPDNNIPRVFSNTGIEYKAIVKYVKSLTDPRIVILNQTKNIKKTLNEYGYPFKSKEHSLRVEAFNKGSNAYYIMEKYLKGEDYNCPKILKYQFLERGKYNYSNKCCYKLKKDLMKKWQKLNNKTINITGMRKAEGGNRKNISCLTNNKKSFHPLAVVDNEWENYFITHYNIKLCELYYPPYNFERTGCKGCPFNINIEKDLTTLYKLLPDEYKQCLLLWKPVYDEYIRIGYRLKKYPHEEV